MTAKDILSPKKGSADQEALSLRVASDLPMMEVLPRLLEAPGHRVAVVNAADESVMGVIDEKSFMEGLGHFVAPRDDSSTVVVECRPEAYSASEIARAVEDADAALVDLWSVPTQDGMIRVTLRVRHSDPSMAVRSLERYGYTVIETHGSENADAQLAAERLATLSLYLNV